MSKNIDTRQFDRVTFQRAIQYEHCEMQPGRIVNAMESGNGVDISNGGMGLVTKCKLKCGEVMKLHIPADAVKANMPVYSLVVWVKPKNDYFHAGLRFLA